LVLKEEKMKPAQFIYKEENGETYAIVNPKYTEFLLQEKYNLGLKLSKIPKQYWNISFDDYKGDKNNINYKKVIYFAQNLEKSEMASVSLYLYGIHSSQKTTLAVNILKEGIKKGYKCRFVLAGELIDNLMKIQGFKFNIDLDSWLKDLSSSDLLVIDDIFDPNKALFWKNSDNKNMIIAEWDSFLRSYLSKGSRLILTSNFDVESIKQYYGESLYELIDRNVICLYFGDSIKEERKNKLSSIFEHIK